MHCYIMCGYGLNFTTIFFLQSGGGIHEFSDSQFGKLNEICALLGQLEFTLLKLSLTFCSGHVFAFGESRALAIANMVLGLKEIQIRGEIRTNVDYTIDLLHVRFLLPTHKSTLCVCDVQCLQ